MAAPALAGRAKVLVASDAMTRGMDVDNVQNIVNYDAPVYAKTYVHRQVRRALHAFCHSGVPATPCQGLAVVARWLAVTPCHACAHCVHAVLT